ncbi:MAG: hypothetical protein H7A25_23625 [Leptospiraceae bacterium]|nr:hypothetical protein [Leptospiraceae bacterium]MCP5502911.1 hypothetical protein [Leptospiraceae bacterium]
MNNGGLDPKIEGYLIITLKKIRYIDFIELLNYTSENRFDEDLEFYISRLGTGIYDKEINIHRANRLRSIASNFVKYKIFYTFSLDNIEEELRSYPEHDDGRPFDYILSSFCENIIEEYSKACLDFYKKSQRIPGEACCRLKDINELLEEHKFTGKEIVNYL